jgi:hypothetical protein
MEDLKENRISSFRKNLLRVLDKELEYTRKTLVEVIDGELFYLRQGLQSDRIEDKELKVCVLGTFNTEFSSSIYFADALKKIKGVSFVKEFDYKKMLQEIQDRDSQIKIVVDLAREYDLLIIFKGLFLPYEAIREASKHCITYLWYMDWYNNIQNRTELSKYCHYRSATGYETACLLLEDIGLPVNHVLDAAPIEDFYPIGMYKKYDITFIGNPEEERTEIYTFLKKEGFRVNFFGLSYSGKFVYPKEFREICSQSKIVLNISRGNLVGYSSLRLWLLLACGSFVLTKHIPSMQKYLKLEAGIHLDEFRELPDLKEKIIYYLSKKHERRKIARAGLLHIKNHRTWLHSAQEVIDIVRTQPKRSIVD